MPVYEYTGVNRTGKKVKGLFDAENPRSLRDALKAQHIYVTEFAEGKKALEKKKGDIELPWENRISLRDVAILTRQLATQQKAGIPLATCLTALVEQTEHEALKAVLSDVRQKVNEGSSLNAALADHPKAFSDLYVNMIRAGESTGALDTVLYRLADFLDTQVGLRSKISGALAYPILMSILSAAIVAFLMGFVVPKITQIYADQEEGLPLITRILIAASNFIASWWFLVFLVACGFGFYSFLQWKKTDAGRAKWDAFVLRSPVFGKLTRLIAMTRFSRTLATLLGAGVPLLKALDIIKNILGNTVLINVVEQARLNIREGESIAVPLKRSGEFPPMVTHMIAVGEQTGALEEMLHNVADSYDQQVDAKITSLTSLLEPVMIVVMGGAVAFIVFAILIPILRMNSAAMG